MSARKMTDTKIPEDEGDSGFLSGPIPEHSDEISGQISGEIKSDEKKVPSASVSENDSGVLVLTEDLTKFKLEPETLITLAPRDSRHPLADTNTTKILPPLSVLFKQDDDGDTQLHIAAVHGCEKAVGTLIRVCPNKEWFNVPNDDGQTALHLAALSGNAVVTRMLVIAGASVAVRDRMGETPLHKATVLKNVECIKALLNPVKELPQRKLSTVLNQKNYNGQACVHLAASAGHIETLQALVYYGADINCRENLAGWSALHIAAQRGDAGALHYLQRCPGVQRRARDHARRTPRRLARRHAPALRALGTRPEDSDTDSDCDAHDHMYDSDEGESLFDKIRDSLNTTLVA